MLENAPCHSINETLRLDTETCAKGRPTEGLRLWVACIPLLLAACAATPSQDQAASGGAVSANNDPSGTHPVQPAVQNPAVANTTAPMPQSPTGAWGLLAQYQDRTNPTNREQALRVAQAIVEDEHKENALAGFNFGTGIGASFDLHSGSRIKSALLVDDGSGNKTVRVNQDGDTQLGIILETHYFWTIGTEQLIGVGPFFAIRTGDNDIIDEAGLGIMAGFRRNKTDTNSFNIGLGVMLDPDAQVLADGYFPNLAPPSGSSDVRYKQEERFSLAIVFSYSF